MYQVCQIYEVCPIHQVCQIRYIKIYLVDEEIKENVLCGEEKPLKTVWRQLKPMNQTNAWGCSRSGQQGGPGRAQALLQLLQDQPRLKQGTEEEVLPAFEKKCEKCDKVGHLRSQCYSQKPRQSGEPQKSQSKVSSRPSMQRRWRVCSKSWPSSIRWRAPSKSCTCYMSISGGWSSLHLHTSPSGWKQTCPHRHEKRHGHTENVFTTIFNHHELKYNSQYADVLYSEISPRMDLNSSHACNYGFLNQ